MDVSKLKRDASKIHAIRSPAKDNTLKVTKACNIYVPARYTEKPLAVIGNEISVVGIFATVVDDKYYGVTLVDAMVPIGPSVTNTVQIEDNEYLEFQFSPGDTFITNLNLIRRDTLVYRIFDELVAKGNTPWYLTYSDIGTLFDTALFHGDANLGSNHAILEMITASRARTAKDRSKFYRYSLKDSSQLVTDPPVMIPLNSVQFGATNTTAKLMGAYFDEGLNAALVNPSTRSEKIEDHLLR